MPAHASSDLPHRQLQIAQILEDVLSRRMSGETVSDERVIADHPDLMPELESRLHDLAHADRARRAAFDTTDLPREFLSPLPDDTASRDWLADGLPQYEILRELKRGGQGVVFLGMHRRTRRQVAIKVLKEGPLASERERARFEREAHILGRLNHPNIVAVHDTGTVAGCAYLVMDYISGHGLDEYVREKRPPRSELIELFATICEAVHTAHLLGVVHRDLKPANIRVDENGQPHVLDFGLARTAAADITEYSGQFIGTLHWASPEQAEGRASLVDARTDVYALGVILYKLLTDRFPYDVTGSGHRALDEIVRTPPRRASRIDREIAGDLDTILLKCLEKERARRYASAGDLARDIRHYIDGEPLEARRDSTWYVWRKTIRRHRAPAAVAAALLLVVSSAAFVSTVFWKQAASERDRAVAAERRAANAARRAGVTAAFLESMFTSLQPDVIRGRDPEMMRELLDQAARTLDGLQDAPEVRARMQALIGTTYATIGDIGAAEPLLRGSVRLRRELLAEGAEGASEDELAETLVRLGYVCKLRGQYDEAVALYEEALDTHRELHGPDDPHVATDLNYLGTTLQNVGRYGESEAALREALRIRTGLFGENHPETVNVLNNLALLDRARRDPAGAAQWFARILAVYRSIPGENRSRIAVVQNNLAQAQLEAGHLDLAAANCAEALQLRRQLWPAERWPDGNQDLASSLAVLAEIRMGQEDYADAERVLRECLAMCRKLLPDADHHWRAQSLQSLLGEALTRQQRFEAAEPELLAGFEGLRRSRGIEHLETVKALRRIVSLYDEWGRPDEADRYRRFLESVETPATADSASR